MVAQIVSIIGGLATSVLFARYLDSNNYGVYRYLVGLAALFSAFSLTGLGQSILQATAKKYYSFYRETLKTNFIYSLGITAAGLIGGLYYTLNENVTLAAGCILIAFLQPLVTTFGNTVAYLQGTQHYKESTLAQSLKTAIVTLSAIFSILLTDNVLILFGIFLVSQLLTNYVTHTLYKPKKESENLPKAVLESYKSYARHTSGRNIIAGIANKADTIILFTQLGATDLALYTISMIIPEQIKGSFKNLSNLILPKYARAENTDIIHRSLPTRSVQLFFLFSVVSLVYIVLSPYIYTLLFPQYETAATLSQYIALSFPASAAILPLGLLQVQRKEKALHQFNIQSSAVLLILTLILIPKYGVLGAVIARILSRYSNLLLSFYHLKRTR